jgi:hypothetical protein
MNNNEESSTDAGFLFSMIKERYGARLTPEELEKVREGIEAIQRDAEALRAVKLINSDEPLALFVPYRDEG